MAMSRSASGLALTPTLVLIGLWAMPLPVAGQITGDERIRKAMENSLLRQQASVRSQLSTQQRRQRALPVNRPFPVADAQPVLPVAPPADSRCATMSPDELSRQIETAATANDLSSGLLRAVARAESGFQPCAVSAKGARGLMQIMPATGRDLGLVDPWDSEQNLTAGAKYLRQLLDRFGGDVALALGAYNAGPATVDRYGAVPPIEETRDYVRRIMLEMHTKADLGRIE